MTDEDPPFDPAVTDEGLSPLADDGVVLASSAVAARGFDAAEAEAALQSMLDEMNALISGGQWFSGPADLMSLIEEANSELAHSKMIQWLLTPTGRHGLGDDLLRRVLAEKWPKLELPETAHARVRREVSRDDEDRNRTIADVIVRMGNTTLVIENKVQAVEGREQCERLFQRWRETAEQVCFLFLTPGGGEPLTACTEEAKACWRSMSYSLFATLLEQSLASRPSGRADGEPAARQYLMTLRTTIGRPSTAALTRGG